MTKTTRRTFIKQSSAFAASVATGSVLPGSLTKKSNFPYLRNPKVNDKFIILGMDGLDPDLVRRFVAEGIMPTFGKMLETNYFGPLRTTMPAQSPVAWASFITGTDPGGHGIFDFIHRDPASLAPYLSTSRSFDAAHHLKLGSWSMPLGSGRVELMRKGQPFWSFLEREDIPTVVHQIPSNFPVIESPTKAVSGMGTPDLLGSYGTFTYFSETFVPGAEELTGGRVERLRLSNHSVTASLGGPKNPFKKGAEDVQISVRFVRDPQEPLVKIEIQDQTFLVKEKEWTEWIPLRFEYLPWLSSAAGMVRFYVKEVHPKLKIYCTPINVDPMEPALPIASPAGYGEELAHNIGRFYTQGLPADTKALSRGILDDDEYFSQAKLVLEESMRGLEYGLSQFKEGVFFHYFSSIDQNSHMLMRAMDPNHPLYNPNASPEVKNAIKYLYHRMDDALAMTLKYVDSRTVLAAISDHGFTRFYREFHLNTWLVEQGFMTLTDRSKMEDSRFFDYVDWRKTKAYGLGFNGLYINRAGRDKNGVISAEEAESVKADLISKLPTVRDPKGGEAVVSAAYDSSKIYTGTYISLAPDILVGYNRGYRSSDETVLGRFKKEIVGDRVDKWSADHCIDHMLVPGSILLNRPCKVPDPAIWEFAPTILRNFSIEPPSEMKGRTLI